MRVSIGSRVALRVRTGREGDSLHLFADVETPFGVITSVHSIHVDTLRALLIWARSNYGTLAYDFAVNRLKIG
jgi:hypothetical protein